MPGVGLYKIYCMMVMLVLFLTKMFCISQIVFRCPEVPKCCTQCIWQIIDWTM